MRRTIAAASKPGPSRRMPPGSTVVAKKLAVSLTRRAARLSDRDPVIAIGSAAYSFRNVARNAPRMPNGAASAADTRSLRAPRSTMLRSIQSGTSSIAAMKATSSSGASSTASTPSRQATRTISIRRCIPKSGMRAT